MQSALSPLSQHSGRSSFYLFHSIHYEKLQADRKEIQRSPKYKELFYSAQISHSQAIPIYSLTFKRAVLDCLDYKQVIENEGI